MDSASESISDSDSNHSEEGRRTSPLAENDPERPDNDDASSSSGDKAQRDAFREFRQVLAQPVVDPATIESYQTRLQSKELYAYAILAELRGRCSAICNAPEDATLDQIRDALALDAARGTLLRALRGGDPNNLLAELTSTLVPPARGRHKRDLRAMLPLNDASRRNAAFAGLQQLTRKVDPALGIDTDDSAARVYFDWLANKPTRRPRADVLAKLTVLAGTETVRALLQDHIAHQCLRATPAAASRNRVLCRRVLRGGLLPVGPFATLGETNAWARPARTLWGAAGAKPKRVREKAPRLASKEYPALPEKASIPIREKGLLKHWRSMCCWDGKSAKPKLDRMRGNLTMCVFDALYEREPTPNKEPLTRALYVSLRFHLDLPKLVRHLVDIVDDISEDERAPYFSKVANIVDELEFAHFAHGVMNGKRPKEQPATGITLDLNAMYHRHNHLYDAYVLARENGNASEELDESPATSEAEEDGVGSGDDGVGAHGGRDGGWAGSRCRS